MCADQKQFKYILLVEMVSTPKGLANNSPISPMTSTPVKKARDRKSLCLFTNILDMKKKPATRRFGAAKLKSDEIEYGTIPW